MMRQKREKSQKIEKHRGAGHWLLFTGYYLCLGVLVSCCLLLLPQTVQAATYCVDANNGNDNNNGLSVGTAWRTIDKANAGLQPGDTVYIRAGTYRETIRPSRSGTAGNYITYARYNNENVTVTGGTYGANLDQRSYIIIDGLTIQDVTYPVHMFSTHYCIIQNCRIYEWTGWGGIYLRETSSYNKILNNYISKSDALIDDGDIIVIGDFGSYDSCHHNLVEGNEVTSGNRNVHAGIHIYGEGADVAYNIVRKNTAYNIRRFGGVIGAYRNVFENNIGYNMGHSHPSDPGAVENFRVGGKYNIFRNNVEYEHNNVGKDAPYTVGQYTQVGYYNNIPEPNRYNKIYHNTIWGHSGFGVQNSLLDSGLELDDQVYKNNILYNNGLVGGAPYQIYYAFNVARPPTDIWDGNLIMKDATGRSVIQIWNPQSSGVYTLSQAKTNLPVMFLPNNIEGDPQFVDAPNDFHLQAGSPCIDAGVYLTHTTTAGTGTTIPIDDAGYFIDGWNIVEGDLIQLEGQTQTARITNVDYDTNTITVNTPLSWSSGQGVSLAYTGSAPDIGAYEYSSSTFLYGDVSGDGEISAYDAALTAQAAVDLITLTAEQTRAADVSGEGEVSAYDAALIAQRAVGLIEKFPVEM